MRCPPGTMSLPAAAARLQLDYRTIRRLVAAGRLRGGRHGHYRHWHVNAADVTAYLAARASATLDALITPSPSHKESVS